MKALNGLKGVLALMGRNPMTDFRDYFGDAKPAFQNSLAAIGGSVLLILIAARGVISLQRRAALDEAVDTAIPAFQIGITAGLYLLAFTLIAFMLCLVFDRRGAYLRWAVLRHWMVFYALVPTAVVLTLAAAGWLPAALANGVLFAVFIGWIFADIRVAYKAGELGLMSAVFAACMVHAMGLSVILTAVVQMIP